MPSVTLDAPIATSMVSPALRPGDTVEVRNRFDGRWSSGFRVEAVMADEETCRYRVQRVSDGHVLPLVFDDESLLATR